MCVVFFLFFFFQAEDGIRDRSPSRGLGDVYKRQGEDEGEYSGNPKPLQAGYELREGCGGGQDYDREYSYCRLDHGVPKYQGTRLRDAHAPNIVAAGSSVMEEG